ncbi:MAG TPA: prepilin-type N-terminal cleavage/methylation domain-containing protein [Candidatus Hydrogenedentes bacterium]|nr:prepilin-type N-terminal cleavage/methylation domain-containing protein [Candidatus Hydrogenedentota bacterium]
MTRHNAQGFTLIEIMAALAILGMSLFVLLQSHYSALRLYDTACSETMIRELLQRTMNYAELQVLAGTLGEEGDFGMRYPEYVWSFESSLVGQDELIQLYEVNVTVRAPDGVERLISFLTYNPSAEVQEKMSK